MFIKWIGVCNPKTRCVAEAKLISGTTPTCCVDNGQVGIKMAQEEGGYSNPAMEPESVEVAETSLTADELSLRVDKLEVGDSSKNAAAMINTDDMEVVPGVGAEANDMPLPNLTRNRPFSASTMSRQTVASTRSHASRSPSILTSEYSANNLFSYRVCSATLSVVIRSWGHGDGYVTQSCAIIHSWGTITLSYRYEDFSLTGIFAPRSESSQWEPSGSHWEPKVPGNFRSWERMFPGTFVPGIVSSLSDHDKGCWHCSEKKSKKYSKMNAKHLPRLLLNKAENFRTLLMWMYRNGFASSLWENNNE